MRSAAKPVEGGEEAAAETAAAETPAFEERLARLEALVEELEAGELPLERALAVFEEGVQLSRSLDGELGRAEQRVEVLLREGGGLSTRPFEGATDAGEEGGEEAPDGESWT